MYKLFTIFCWKGNPPRHMHVFYNVVITDLEHAKCISPEEIFHKGSKMWTKKVFWLLVLNCQNAKEASWPKYMTNEYFFLETD
jgi:hypothetical protein